MKATPAKIIQLMVLLFAIIFHFSCSKDTDLLADYVISDAQEAHLFANLAIDDYFVVAKDSEIVLDVLSNDSYENPDKVKIVNVSQPENGTVSVNEDKTLTYIPDSFDTSAESTDTAEKEKPKEIEIPEATDEPTETPQQEGTPEGSQAPGVSETPEETTSPDDAAPQENQSSTEEEKSTSQSFSYTTETVNPDKTTKTTEATVTIITDNQSNEISYGVDYYVTTNGSIYDNGRTEATAWSIEKAFSSAKAGDVVAIKAGDYGNKQLIVGNSGTTDRPIRFIGYKDTPGDVVSEGGSTFQYGDRLDASTMPMLVGNNPNGEGQGTGITIGRANIHIENFQLTQFKSGIQSHGTHTLLKNIISIKMGDFNPTHTYPKATKNKLLNYSGNGIVMSGDGSQLHNSFVLNAGAQAVTINKGNGITAKNNAVYADDTVNPTDYYFLISSKTTNSNFFNTKVVRVGQLQHHGHGIVLKGSGNITGNTIDGFEVVNTFLELQFPNTSHNIVKNGTVIKQENVNANTTTVAGIKLANGSHHNTYQNIEITNCSILFQDWNDGLPGDANDVSDNNTFENIRVRNSNSGIAFNFFGVENHTSSADNNTFTNCTFENLNYLFERDRKNTGTKLINCVIKNVNQFAKKNIANNPDYPIDATYQNCTWINTGFTSPD